MAARNRESGRHIPACSLAWVFAPVSCPDRSDATSLTSPIVLSGLGSRVDGMATLKRRQDPSTLL